MTGADKLAALAAIGVWLVAMIAMCGYFDRRNG